MSYLITLGLVETIYDPIVDRIKMVLAGATTIKRDRLHNGVVNELVVFMVLLLVLVLVLVLVLLLLLVLMQDNTKGIPLVDDVLPFSVRSVRSMMNILSCILKME